MGKRQGENLMQNANGQEKRQGCQMRSDDPCAEFNWGEERRQTNQMQNGEEGEEERRGNANVKQRSWHPSGKVLGNVVGGIVGHLRGGENLMQNANGQEKRQGENLMQNANGQEERQGENLMQNGPGGEEERREQTNEMQNGGEGEEERECAVSGGCYDGMNPMQMQEEEGEEERRKMCMYGPDGTPDETLCQ